MRRGGRPGSPRVLALLLTGALALSAAVSVAVGGAPHLLRAPAQAARAPDGGSAAAAAEQRRDADVRAALARMNTALAIHDEAMFASVVLPGSSAFQHHQHAVYRALVRMPFRQVRYAWSSGDTFAVPGLEARYHAATVVIAAKRVYDLAGWDAKPVEEVLGLSFVQRGAQWYLGGDSDANGRLLRGGFAEPWGVGDISVARAAHVLVVGDADAAAATRRLATRVEGLLGPVARVWPDTGWNGRVVVYAVTDPRFVRAWFGRPAATGHSTRPTDPATFDALVREVSAVVQTGSLPLVRAGVRVVLSPALLDNPDRAEVDLTLRHELAHVVTEGLGSPPVWVVEGAAEYTAARVIRGGRVSGVGAMARRGMTAQEWRSLRDGTFSVVLPTEADDFYSGSFGKVDDAYTSAWLAMLYIADHWGEATMRRFYTEIAHSSDDPADAEEQAIHDVLRTTHARLVAAVDRYARGLRRSFA